MRLKLAGILTALLLFAVPALALAQGFAVSPAEVTIENLAPGEKAEFRLTVHNKEEVARTFVFTVFQPAAEERREGREQFPSTHWINFSPSQLQVPPGSSAEVTVTVSIPREEKWADKDWEVWLGVSSPSSHLLNVQLYVRLLVSTSSVVSRQPSTALLLAVITAAVLLGCGAYYLFRSKRRTRP
jgi:hypothetical protein